MISAAALSQSFPDPQLTAIATKESIIKAQEIDAYTLAVMAYTWGYPLVRMERVAREYIDMPPNKPATSYRAPLNQIGWATDLATPAAKDMPTANNDTYYMSAVVTLTEPYVLTVPDTRDRYYVINVFNMYHDHEFNIGRRTTGTKAGKFVIIPPGWKGKTPPAMKAIPVVTDKVWLWGRIHIEVDEDPKPVWALQKQFDLRPLSQAGNVNYKAPAATLPQLPDIAGNELGFFVHLGYAMQQNTIKQMDDALVGQLERIGLTKAKGFDPSKLTTVQVDALKKALADAQIQVAAAVANTSTIRNGWNWAPLSGFGYNYPLRSVIAGPYLGGNISDEAMYPNRFTDADNKQLNGTGKYEMRFSKTPPVNAFWSLTIYNNDDKMLVDNPVNRYKISDKSPGFTVNADGSFTIYIQNEAPEGSKKANWLPAPKGDFNLFLRFYQPAKEILNETYPLPQVERIK
ncbi:MAG: DUF1214 domain-containing protein [Agriterribacter sp.]